MTDNNRIPALDFLRGIAAMGMALTSIGAIGLPSAALFNPFEIGTNGPLDLITWAFDFLLVDGKFRALFAMILGASMLLFMESAELDGRDSFAEYRGRMIWLAGLGLACHLLLWSGDLLLPLALTGLIATLLAGRDTFALVKWALGLLALQWFVDLAAVHLPFALASFTHRTDSSTEIALYGSSYGVIAIARGAALGRDLLNMAFFVLPEMLAFAAFGMAMLKGGFLSAQWTADQYQATWRRGYLMGLVPMAALAAWILVGRTALSALTIGFGWSVPLRLPLAAAHAALAMAIVIRFPGNILVRAVQAVGRLALSNTLLLGLVAPLFFYGYGAGMFARLDRTFLLGLAVHSWIFMLFWSTAWQRWIGKGPVEWLWRRVADGRVT